MANQSKPTIEITIRNEYLGESKTLKAKDRETLARKVLEQEKKWQRSEEWQRLVDEERHSSRKVQDAIMKLQTLLERSLQVDYRLKWATLYRQEAFPEFENWCALNNHVIPVSPSLDDYLMRFAVPKPSILEALFAFLENNRLGLERKAKAAFETDMHQSEVQMQQLQDNYSTKRLKCETETAAYNLEIDELRRRYEAGDGDGIRDYLAKVFDFHLCDCGHDHQTTVDFRKDTATAVTTCWLPTLEDMPVEKGFKAIKTRRTLEAIAMTEKQRRELYEGVCYQHVLQSLNMVFGSDYANHVQTAVFNGWIQAINPATGKVAKACVISCMSDRSKFAALDLSRVVPKECVNGLHALVTGSIDQAIPVTPIMEMTDPRFIPSREVLDHLELGENLADMDWKDFEHLVTEVLEKEHDWKITTTRSSRDGGVDAIAVDSDPIRGGKYVIQAKRYNNIVDVSAVRDLHGTVHHEGAMKGILVTTSSFGADSHKYASDKPLKLVNGRELTQLCRKHGYNVRCEVRPRPLRNK